MLLSCLCGPKTWFVTLREGQRLVVFENKILRMIFRLRREAVIGGRIKLNNEYRHNLHSSNMLTCGQLKEDETVGSCRL
jgi:hypothetical protein